MPTQKALLVKELGKPLVLVDNHDIPEPGPGQVQIKVSVAGLNPHDQRSRDWGLLIADMLPFVLGKDVVGTVAKLGEGVKDLNVGDRVMSLADSATDSSQSGLQEYAVADVVHCARIPANLSDSEAATLPTNLSSVFIALYITLGLPAPWAKDISNPEKLLVVGGGSNCGRLTVQLAKLAGIPKIVVVGGDEHELKALGATHVIDRHGDEDAVSTRVQHAVGDDLVYAFDTVNFPEGLGLALKSLSKEKNGKLVRLVPMGSVEDTKGHELLDVLGNQHFKDPLCLSLWERLPGYIEEGSIRPTPYSVWPVLKASVVNAALNEYRDGKKVTKPHIHI